MTPEQKARCAVMSLMFEVHHACGDDDVRASDLLRQKIAHGQSDPIAEYCVDEVLRIRRMSPEERASDFRNHLASLPSDEQQARRTIAHHEAGHAIALKALREPVVFATIEPQILYDDVPRGGIVRTLGRLTPRSAILFALAGPAAEARITGLYFCEGDDAANAATALKRLSKPIQHYRDEVAVIVDQLWSEIVRLADALMNRGTLWTAREISQLSGWS